MAEHKNTHMSTRDLKSITDERYRLRSYLNQMTIGSDEYSEKKSELQHIEGILSLQTKQLICPL